MSETHRRFSWFGFLLGPLIFFYHRYLMAGLASIFVQAVLIFAYVMVSGVMADILGLSLLILNILHGFWKKWFHILPQEWREVSRRSSFICMTIGIMLSLLAVTPIVKSAWDKAMVIVQTLPIPEE